MTRTETVLADDVGALPRMPVYRVVKTARHAAFTLDDLDQWVEAVKEIETCPGGFSRFHTRSLWNGDWAVAGLVLAGLVDRPVALPGDALALSKPTEAKLVKLAEITGVKYPTATAKGQFNRALVAWHFRPADRVPGAEIMHYVNCIRVTSIWWRNELLTKCVRERISKDALVDLIEKIVPPEFLSRTKRRG